VENSDRNLIGKMSTGSYRIRIRNSDQFPIQFRLKSDCHI